MPPVPRCVPSQRAAAPSVLSELVSGRLRLSKINKFQIGVVLIGCALAYFYYSIKSYFVLT